MLYYIPGCDVRKNHPEAVRKMQRYMETAGAAAVECCRKDLGRIGPEDVVVQNCTLCQMVLRERLPETASPSLYEYLVNADFPFPNHHGRVLTLQDCFRTREDERLHCAVRECLRRMNIQVVEAPENRGNTRFCGVWLNNPSAPDLPELTPGIIRELEPYRELLPPEEQERKMKKWVSRYGTEEVAVYCNGCERGILLGGGKPVHMIELLASGLQ